MSIPLTMDYDMVAETLSTTAVPLYTMTPLTLMSLAFIIGKLDKALLGKPDDLFVGDVRGSHYGARCSGRDGRRCGERAGGCAGSVHDRGQTNGCSPRGGKGWRDAVGGLVTGTVAGQYGRLERPASQHATQRGLC